MGCVWGFGSLGFLGGIGLRALDLGLWEAEEVQSTVTVGDYGSARDMQPTCYRPLI